MLIYDNKEDKIQLDFTNTISYEDQEEFGGDVYVVDLPQITCTNYKHAQKLQSEVNLLIQKLSRELLGMSHNK